MILSTTNSFIVGSDLAGGGQVQVESFNSSGIASTVLAVSVSVAIGSNNGAAASIGASRARNLIGYQTDGSIDVASSISLIDGSSIDTVGDLIQSATTSQTVGSLVLAASAAVSASGNSGLAISGAGVSATNKIAADARAILSNVPSSDSVQAANLSVTASDVSLINSLAGAVSLALAATGQTGGSVSIGLGLAENVINTEVQASIDTADIDATSVTVAASESARIDATAFAATASVGVGGSGGLGVAGAGANATNVINTKTDAFIANSDLFVATRSISMRPTTPALTPR